MSFAFYKKKIDKNGFVIIKKLINKNQVNELLKGLEATLDYCISLILKRKKRFKNLDQKYIWLQKNNNKLKGRGYDISRFHPSVYKVLLNRKLTSFVKYYFKKEVYIDYPHLLVSDYLNKRLLPLHQDEYGSLSSNLLTLWLPLTNVSKKNGTLSVIKASHKEGKLKHKFYKENFFRAHGVVKEKYKNSKITYIKLNAGDAVLFHSHLIHGTAVNKSKKLRINYVARFNEISGIEYLKNLKSPHLRIPQKK